MNYSVPVQLIMFAVGCLCLCTQDTVATVVLHFPAFPSKLKLGSPGMLPAALEIEGPRGT